MTHYEADNERYMKLTKRMELIELYETHESNKVVEPPRNASKAGEAETLFLLCPELMSVIKLYMTLMKLMKFMNLLALLDEANYAV